MGIKAKFTYSDIERAINKDLISIEKNILSIMSRVGEEFVSDAKNAVNISPSAFPKGDYTDQTANLRSSIGYFILRDNQIVSENVSGTMSGTSKARNVLTQIGYKSGYRLVGVAGMEYASNLESRGYNVITSQQLDLIVNLGDRLRKYSSQLGKKGIQIDFGSDFIGQTSTL